MLKNLKSGMTESNPASTNSMGCPSLRCPFYLGAWTRMRLRIGLWQKMAKSILLNEDEHVMRLR